MYGNNRKKSISIGGNNTMKKQEIIGMLWIIIVMVPTLLAQDDIFRKITIPQIDLAGETKRQIIVDQEAGQYLGHVTAVLLDDGKTILTVYPKGHAAGQIVYKKSTDGGLTWSERLKTPDNWTTGKDVPCLMRMIDKQGKQRIMLFSGRLSGLSMYGRYSLSEDEGETWQPLENIGYWGDTCIADAIPIDIPTDGSGAVSATGFDCQMIPDSLRNRSGKYLTIFGNFGAAVGKTCYIWTSETEDGGVNWSYPKVVWEGKEMNPTEAGLVRSPDGKQIAALWRDTRRQHNSQIMFSNDEGKTWTQPRAVPLAQCGERHTIRYLKDGRLFISFRCCHHLSNTTPWHGDWGAWIGTYDDLVNGTEGQYRIRLMDNLDGWDCAYPGVVVLPDGTVVTITYGTWEQGKQKYIMAVRLHPDEIDKKASKTK
jgi:hypothetical protein